MKNISQRAAVIALLLGILAVPAVVLASTALLDAGSAQPKALAPALTEPRRAEIEQPVAAVAAVEPAVAAEGTVSDPDRSATAADLELACGAEGASLVARETAGDISTLEQAALDALRPICSEAGLPLAAAAAPDPVVIVETVMTIPVASSAPPVTTAGDDHEDEHDDDGHDDGDEHEDEHDEDDD